MEKIILEEPITVSVIYINYMRIKPMEEAMSLVEAIEQAIAITSNNNNMTFILIALTHE
jgi:hypothetical protein